MLSVEMTSMPASSSCSTSCQRFSLREPGALVWAYSSTSTTSGRRARIASTSISCSTVPRYSTSRRGITSRSRICSAVCDAAVGLDEADRRHRCRVRAGGRPRRASCTSCRRRARHRGRCAASRGPSRSVLRFGVARSRARVVEREVELEHVARPARRGRRSRGRRCARRSSVDAPRRRRGRVRRRRAAPAGGRWRSRCAGRGRSPTP